jgi:hypothetical protein
LQSLNAVPQVAHLAIQIIVACISLCACIEHLLRVSKLALQVGYICGRTVVLIS